MVRPKSKIPDRWLDYKPLGQRIPETRFICCKCPLKEELCRKLPSKSKWFTPECLLRALAEENATLGLVIDLTNTDRYYSPNDFTYAGIEYAKICTPGHDVPGEEGIAMFRDIIVTYDKKYSSKDSLIAVHCTHGVNRTGYQICHYLIETCGWSYEKAVENFNLARGYPIERENYLTALKELDDKVNNKPHIFLHDDAPLPDDEDDDDPSDTEVVIKVDSSYSSNLRHGRTTTQKVGVVVAATVAKTSSQKQQQRRSDRRRRRRSNYSTSSTSSADSLFKPDGRHAERGSARRRVAPGGEVAPAAHNLPPDVNNAAGFPAAAGAPIVEPKLIQAPPFLNVLPAGSVPFNVPLPTMVAPRQYAPAPGLMPPTAAPGMPAFINPMANMQRMFMMNMNEMQQQAAAMIMNRMLRPPMQQHLVPPSSAPTFNQQQSSSTIGQTNDKTSSESSSSDSSDSTSDEEASSIGSRESGTNKSTSNSSINREEKTNSSSNSEDSASDVAEDEPKDDHILESATVAETGVDNNNNTVAEMEAAAAGSSAAGEGAAGVMTPDWQLGGKVEAAEKKSGAQKRRERQKRLNEMHKTLRSGQFWKIREMQKEKYGF